MGIKEEKLYETKQVIRYRHYCDACNVELLSDTIYLSVQQPDCFGCKKYFCNKCTKLYEHPEDVGYDYPRLYCQVCWDMGATYRNQIVGLEEQIDKLYEEWNKECKNN